LRFLRISLFINAADQPANQQETRFALAVVELQVSLRARWERFHCKTARRTLRHGERHFLRERRVALKYLAPDASPV
jgi:hypothetical protein